MRASKPVENPDKKHCYTVTIEIETQREKLEEEMPNLLKFIHDKLSNDHITFELELNDGPSSPSTWSEREIIAHLSEENPNFKKFVQALKLSLT